MSRRQHTTLILQVRIPVPAGKTQAATVRWVQEALINAGPYPNEVSAFISAQTQVKITGRETVYL